MSPNSLTCCPTVRARPAGRGCAEERIRVPNDSGTRNLPLHDLVQNQIWLETVLLATDVW